MPLIPLTPQERAKDKRLRTTFNSSLEKFNAKMEEQGYCCAICQRPFVAGANPTGEFKKEVYSAFFDHAHRCCPRRLKKFCGRCCRGILCFTCNKFVVGVLEKLKIDIDRLYAYIKKWDFIEPREHPLGRAKRAKRTKRPQRAKRKPKKEKR
jgi:hypothetical protein